MQSIKYSHCSIYNTLKLSANDILNTFDEKQKQIIINKTKYYVNNNRVNQKNLLSKDQCIQYILDCYKQNNVLTSEILYTNTPVTNGLIRKYWNSFNNMLKDLNLPLNIRKNITKQDVLTHMWKLYKQHGKLNSIIQRKDGTISQAMIKRLFGNFNDMLKEMGLDNKIFKPSDDDLLVEAKELINKYGTINTNILHQHSKYAYQTYLNHFKTMQNLYDRLHIINPKMNYLALHIINIIAKILNTNNYTVDKSNFNWLRHPATKAKLRLDAYFPEYNLAIEYDGKQHFEDISYFTKQLTDIQEYDQVKNQLCKQHNVKLLRIAYNDDLSEENLKKLIYDILENK